VALLSLTRGEGGANLAGPEMYDPLGLPRTEETVAAARYYGVRLYVTRAVDFGFSRRLDERSHIVVSRFHGTAPTMDRDHTRSLHRGYRCLTSAWH
jgi:hypothetical protein